MSLYCATGSVDTDLTPQQLNDLLVESLAKLGDRKNVLAVPPDQSREHSRAGELTGYIYKHYGDKLKAVLPAIGTHTPMRPDQLTHMFPTVPQNLFKVPTGAPTSRLLAKSRRSSSANSQKAS